MKWVAACLVVVGSWTAARVVAAQGAGGAPPTAQFPDAAGGPAPGGPAPGGPAPSTPPLGAPPPAPPTTTQTYPSEAPPPYPPPPPPPGAYPAGLSPAPPSAETDSDEVVSLTISPLHLILPIVQLTGEVRVVPHFGVSLIAGYGQLGLDTTGGDGFSTNHTTVSAYELGGRLIGYPLKKFKSLQLGGQIMYLHLATDGPVNDTGISATGAGVAVGPFVGYKLVTKIGFTFLAQGGFQYLAVRADAQDTSGSSATNEASKLLPLLNLDVGWSF
ncbi:MAG: hypothetical protein ABI548_09520 [Polyangiaceae bacterium]